MAEEQQKITVRPHGPYVVRGQIPLVRKSQVETEYGEPYDWKVESVLETGETYRLCRCGQSNSKPFCDGAHTLVDFDGEEAADTGPIPSREKEVKGGWAWAHGGEPGPGAGPEREIRALGAS